MMVFLIIAAVLIGLAYADFCLIDNTEHFGICFTKLLETEKAELEGKTEAVASLWSSLAERAEATPPPAARVKEAAEPDMAGAVDDPEPSRFRPRPVVPEPLLLLELEPVLELHEAS